MIIDNGVAFGNQNFFFTDSYSDDETYDYVVYQSAKKGILIARFPKDGTSARYCFTQGVYATIVAAREDKEYVLPGQLHAQNVTV